MLSALHPRILRGWAEAEIQRSPHANREASEAYIASQRSEGSALVRDPDTDGGISGGALERLGLSRLVADIEGGLVDVIVVDKIDRLSRALADFVKLVEVFDRNGFVRALELAARAGSPFVLVTHPSTPPPPRGD